MPSGKLPHSAGKRHRRCKSGAHKMRIKEEAEQGQTP